LWKSPDLCNSVRADLHPRPDDGLALLAMLEMKSVLNGS
jgi:hypothetical protein